MTQPLRRHEYTDRVMGVQARLVFYAADVERARVAAEEAVALLHELDRRASTWDPESELVRANTLADGAAVSLSPGLFDLLDQAVRWSHTTHGAFDPTLAPLTELWRESRRELRLPDEARLRAARARTGVHRVHLDADARTLRLDAGTRLDLGGFAKGYACDRAVELLTDAGFERCLVELGGDLALGAPPPERTGWVVAAGCASFDERLLLSHCGVATSGDSVQRVEIDGRRYAHVLDPATGLGVVGPTCVTVVAPDAAAADALATAACSRRVEGLGLAGVSVYRP